MDNEKTKSKEKIIIESEKPNLMWGLLLIGGFLVLLVILLSFAKPNKINTNLGKNYNLDNLVIPQVIDYMKDNNITIYGLTTCPHCKRQYEEFGDFGGQLLLENLYIYCDKVEDEGCNDLKSVPSWKVNGELAHEGYVPMSKIKETFLK